MLTDPELRSQVDQVWDRLWSSGLSNPMDSIEQFSYLLFLKRLDDAENQREKQAKRRNKPFEPQIKSELRWSHWINFKADEALKHVRASNTKRFARRLLRLIAWMGWCRCRLGCLNPMRVFRRRCCCLLVAVQLTRFGSMTWNTTDFR